MRYAFFTIILAPVSILILSCLEEGENLPSVSTVSSAIGSVNESSTSQRSTLPCTIPDAWGVDCGSDCIFYVDFRDCSEATPIKMNTDYINVYEEVNINRTPKGARIDADHYITINGPGLLKHGTITMILEYPSESVDDATHLFHSPLQVYGDHILNGFTIQQDYSEGYKTPRIQSFYELFIPPTLDTFDGIGTPDIYGGAAYELMELEKYASIERNYLIVSVVWFFDRFGIVDHEDEDYDRYLTSNMLVLEDLYTVSDETSILYESSIVNLRDCKEDQTFIVKALSMNEVILGPRVNNSHAQIISFMIHSQPTMDCSNRDIYKSICSSDDH